MIRNNDLKEYFNISNLLTLKSEEDFTKYRKVMHQNKYKFDENNKIKELKFFYSETAVDNKVDYYDSLNRIETTLIVITIIFGILISFLFVDKSIDINIFLAKAIIIPFIFMFFSAISILKYSYPSKKNDSLIIRIFNCIQIKKTDSQIIKIIKSILTFKFDNKYYYVYKAHSIQIFQILGIVFSLTVLFCTILIVIFTSITFSYETTIIDLVWEQRIINLFAFPWAWAFPSSLPNLELIKIAVSGNQDLIKNTPQGTWVVFQIMSIVSWIILPRIILWFFSKKVLKKVLIINLVEEAKCFFDIIFRESEFITIKNSNKEEKKIFLTEEKEYKQNMLYKDFYNIYYELTLIESKTIEFNYDKNKDLQDKTFENYTLGNFEEEDKDEEVILKLANLVLIYISPLSLPDESFKNYIKKIISNQAVKQIWILPLIKKEKEKYTLLNRRTPEYNEWENQINRIISNKKVKLYDER